MLSFLDKSIARIFYLLFFLVPLAFFPQTSELFEFNKIVVTYTLACLIASLWIIKMIVAKKVIFRKTTLDIPIIFFLVSQLLSTLVSIDTRTSLLGYYSRFHGGLASSFTYAILYWAYVSNIKARNTQNAIRYLMASAVIVSVWGILEHFGHSFSCLLVPEFRTFDVSCWVQDVQNRVYATMGQPNWLAAWLIALTPLTWAYGISNYKLLNKLFWIVLSSIFFLTLLYTKSRSGILGFAVADLFFWVVLVWLKLKHRLFSTKDLVIKFSILHFAFLILVLVNGTPWTPKITDIINKPTTSSKGQPASGWNNLQPTTIKGPALETGGTESGQIRKIVWKGAIDIWRNYPVLGSGVETFVFSYYKFRPAEHNLVSEWDYLYNKAHNEYLNIAATTGTVGLLAYLTLIVFSILQISNVKFLISKQVPNPNFKNSKIRNSLGQWRINNPFGFATEIRSISHLSLALLAGFVSILITNFFGFSVVPVALLFFLYPAMAIALEREGKRARERESEIHSLNNMQKLGIIISCSFTLLLFYSVSKYWYADYLYAKGKLQNEAGDPVSARETLDGLIKLSANEPFYWDELASSSADIAIAFLGEGDEELARQFASSADTESKTAVELSPANVNLKRNRANILIKLSVFEPSYLVAAKNTLEEAAKLAPTDAKLFYNLSIAHLRTGDYEKAIEVMEKTANLKPDYRDAFFALALMYIDTGQKEKARQNLEYIFTNINPKDEQAKRELDELK